MPKKNIQKTPRSQIRSTLRRLFLRSREHSFALKRDGYKCQLCGIKQSKRGKDRSRWILVQVHHQNMVENWERLIDMVYQSLLCHPDELIVLCHDCHDKAHQEEIGGSRELEGRTEMEL